MSQKKLKSQAKQVAAAALAPTDPSPQDYQIASKAKMIEIKADREILEEMLNQIEGKKAYENNSNTNEDRKNLEISI